MNLFQLIDDIAKADPEVYDRFDSRRAVFRNFLGFGKKASATALPLALSALFGKAYGQTAGSGLSAAIVATLNLALQLEYLEKYFYQTALNSPNLLNAAQRDAVAVILNDENLHIAALRGLLKGDALADPGRAAFDFTGSQNNQRAALYPTLGGAASPTTALFSAAADFLLLGQQLEDTGVRAYKGGAASLLTQPDILEAALNIHSVEARHAAHLRTLRRGGIKVVPQGLAKPKSWITPEETPALPPLPNGATNAPNAVGPYHAGTPAAAFPDEKNTTQGLAANPFNAQNLVPGISSTAAAEAFDEPLDAATVKLLAKNFVANPGALFN